MFYNTGTCHEIRLNSPYFDKENIFRKTKIIVKSAATVRMDVQPRKPE